MVSSLILAPVSISLTVFLRILPPLPVMETALPPAPVSRTPQPGGPMYVSGSRATSPTNPTMPVTSPGLTPSDSSTSLVLTRGKPRAAVSPMPCLRRAVSPAARLNRALRGRSMRSRNRVTGPRVSMGTMYARLTISSMSMSLSSDTVRRSVRRWLMADCGVLRRFSSM